jgi:parallel beta-helix repeat protein
LTGIWIQDYAINNAICGNNVGDGRNGIKIEGQADGNIVSGNTVTSCQFGIQVLNARYTEISNNMIAHNYGSDEWDAGVRLESADYTVIRDNEIFDNWRGIVLYASSPYVSIYGNNVTNNEYGIRVAMGGSNYVNVSANYVAGNRGYGIDVTGFGGLGGSNYATIARNMIVNNTFEAVGLGTGSNYNTVIQNDMIGNGHAGVTLERYSNYNTVIQNNIIGNAYGICFDLYEVNSTHNIIFNNNIVNNTQKVRIAPGSVNAWNGNYTSGGNYWSDYTGLDQFSGPYQNLTGSDGVGDTPLVIDGNNIDRYPLMEPWTEASSLVGDVNSDGKVDMKDVGYVARRFMCVPGDPLWDSMSDMNGDEKINMVDIGTVARHFGESLS